MAGTLTLRPDEDISGGTGTSYLQICETVADDASTRLGGSSETNSGEGVDFSNIYIFGLSNVVKQGKVDITGVKIIQRCLLSCKEIAASSQITLICNGESIFSNEVSTDTDGAYISFEEEATAEELVLLKRLVEENANHIPEMQLSVKLYAKADYNDGMATEKTSSVYLTQAYVEISYEDLQGIGIYKKKDGAARLTLEAYRKIGESWVEISEEEAKDVLKNNTITEGKT